MSIAAKKDDESDISCGRDFGFEETMNFINKYPNDAVTVYNAKQIMLKGIEETLKEQQTGTIKRSGKVTFCPNDGSVKWSCSF